MTEALGLALAKVTEALGLALAKVTEALGFGPMLLRVGARLGFPRGRRAPRKQAFEPIM